MTRAIGVLQYTTLPPGSAIGLQRHEDGISICFGHRPQPVHQRNLKILAGILAIFVCLFVLLSVLVIHIHRIAGATAPVSVQLERGKMLFGAGLFSALLMYVMAWAARRAKTIIDLRNSTLSFRYWGVRRPIVSYKTSRIASIDGIDGCLSIRLVDGGGWLDGLENIWTYWDDPMPEDELNWLVDVLRAELRL